MAILLSPDVFNTYQRVDTGGSGVVPLTSSLLHLPPKALYIVLVDVPSDGTILLDGVPIVVGDSQIFVLDIAAGNLVWDTGLIDSTLTLDIGYYAYDQFDEVISLLSVYYPPDIVKDVSENIVNGGNFKTGEDGFGVSPDGGDFDTGVLVANGYSYDGGDFDTGERVGVAPPPSSDFNYYEDGQLDPEAQSIITLLDEDLNPILTAELPNSQFIDTTSLPIDLLFDIDYSISMEVSYVTKFFEGFDYGSFEPNYGYNIDYGTVATENPEGYDFNAIQNYEEPTPGNIAT